MSQTLLIFSLMLQPLLIQYVSNGCDKIAVKCDNEILQEMTKKVTFQKLTLHTLSTNNRFFIIFITIYETLMDMSYCYVHLHFAVFNFLRMQVKY